MKIKVLNMRSVAVSDEYDAVVQFVPTWFERFLFQKETTFVMYIGKERMWREFETKYRAPRHIRQLLFEKYVEEVR